MTDVRKISKWVIISTAVILIGYDVWANSTGVPHGTISGVIWDWSHEYASIPLAFGFLMGHFFWQANN